MAVRCSTRSSVARSRRFSLSVLVIGLRPAGSMPASDSSLSSRVTPACNARAFFAVRRTSSVSSRAAFNLARFESACHFREPALARASASARRNSSQRASAVSARALPLRAGMFLLLQGPPVARLARRGRRRGRRNTVVPLDQRKVCPEILVAARHPRKPVHAESRYRSRIATCGGVEEGSPSICPVTPQPNNCSGGDSPFGGLRGPVPGHRAERGRA